MRKVSLSWLTMSSNVRLSAAAMALSISGLPVRLPMRFETGKAC